MPRQWIIEIPLPPRELSPNYRSRTYHAKARATAAYKAACMTAAIAAVSPSPPRLAAATCEATFYFTDPGRRRDGDNLIASLKAALDALTAAGVWVDDNTVRLLPPTIDRCGRPWEERVVLQITEKLALDYGVE